MTSEYMTDDELRRWLDGRHDWQDDKWQDHCGDIDCEQCDGNIPDGNQRAAEARRRVYERGFLPDRRLFS